MTRPNINVYLVKHETGGFSDPVAVIGDVSRLPDRYRDSRAGAALKFAATGKVAGSIYDLAEFLALVARDCEAGNPFFQETTPARKAAFIAEIEAQAAEARTRPLDLRNEDDDDDRRDYAMAEAKLQREVDEEEAALAQPSR